MYKGHQYPLHLYSNAHSSNMCGFSARWTALSLRWLPVVFTVVSQSGMIRHMVFLTMPSLILVFPEGRLSPTPYPLAHIHRPDCHQRKQQLLLCKEDRAISKSSQEREVAAEVAHSRVIIGGLLRHRICYSFTDVFSTLLFL